MTTTVNYSWALPTVGASVNAWGTLVNNILTDIDAKMFARTGGTISGNVAVTGDSSATGSIYSSARGVSAGFLLPDWRMYNTSSGNGLAFNNGSDRMTLDASGNLQVMGRRLSIGDVGYVDNAPGGNVVLNLESLSGLDTAGLLLVRGNENSLNQSIAVYSYNLSITPGGSTRYCRIIQMHRNHQGTPHGDVYAYLSNYSGSYSTADQSYSSAATSTSDIYMRNAAGYGPTNTANFAIIRLV